MRQPWAGAREIALEQEVKENPVHLPGTKMNHISSSNRVPDLREVGQGRAIGLLDRAELPGVAADVRVCDQGY